MPNTLFVRPRKIYQVEDIHYEWALYDIAGEQIKYGANGALDLIDQTLMQNGIENVELVALWPARASFVTEVSLPGGQARFLQQALPFAVEEQVAQDIEQIHIALGAKSKQGGYTVVNIDRSLFEAHYDAIQNGENDFHLSGMYVDADCLVLAESDISICLSDGSVLIKSSDGKLISLKSDNLIPYLDSIFLEPSEDQEAKDLSLRIWVAADYMEQAKMLIAQIEQYPHLKIDIEQYGMSEFEFLCECSLRNKQTLTNLCQGDFKVTHAANSSWRRWRSVAVVAGIGFLLQLGVFIGQGMHYEKQADIVAETALATYQKVVPNSKKVTVGKLPRIIKGKLNQQRQGGSVEVDFLQLLGEAGYQFNRNQYKKQLLFKSINYNQQRAELVLEMQAQSFDQLESLKNAIVSAGLSAKISSAVQEKEYFRGRISVGGA
jgi:general secretion pathway protein L